MPFGSDSLTATIMNNTFRGLHRDFTDNSHTGSLTAADLASVSVTGGTMTATGSLYFFGAGTITSANGTKQITVVFGSTTILDTTANTGTSDWMVRGKIMNTATNAQRIYVEFSDHQSATNFNMDYTTATEDTTAALTLKLVGDLGHVDDTITQTIFTVDVQQIT